VNRQPYERYQFGGSLGGPIVANRAHYFGAYERTRQDTRQVVDTLGVFPAEDGVFDVPFREHLFTGKVTTTFGPQHYVSVRYGRDHNTQPSGAGLRTAHSAWATSTNSFDSVNVNHNWVLGSSMFNEAVVQYSGFVNDIPANSTGPSFQLPNGVRGGTSLFAPQRTEQVKWQFRDDLSWTTTAGLGVSHELRGGVNWVHEPRLRVFAGTQTQGFYMMLDNSLTGPVTLVQVVGNNPTANFPLEQYGLYAQDDWRVSSRVTLNLGVRWDYVDGFPIDQTSSANFQAMQQAGAAGVFTGTLLDDFGKAQRQDRDNVQPRVGAAIDIFGNGRDIVRGGWGLYTDFGYIASNALTAAFRRRPRRNRVPGDRHHRFAESRRIVFSTSAIPSAPSSPSMLSGAVRRRPARWCLRCSSSRIAVRRTWGGRISSTTQRSSAPTMCAWMAAI
jgi:outer membrane receptor protein involved in Fe transport